MRATSIFCDFLPVVGDRQPPEGVSLLEALRSSPKGACAAGRMKVRSPHVHAVIDEPHVACTPFQPVLTADEFLVQVVSGAC